ncbi:uncharacterized protein L969DRAFT_92918 [Mixia osmundae IAM 14324]|uniref:Mitochondrial escape protein 2 n=1 Tax=Mixia osmundae (strain CBS 9802 / IAM 14324 / JCM 22182 / KY 12970) TaxID=764103 RepID=G7DTR8_MIXOS|nr:uncharacterized protein L969DRAFT_92918 [Mixia osmundae IAM 14324]KEI41694.1 hypothetical protein L969DRAFT_92918 [Mixia osmundae IAM 14324]GAA93978.1 hypothetical protein E5Q_00625 [Mixia osmundae IAM 14324]
MLRLAACRHARRLPLTSTRRQTTTRISSNAQATWPEHASHQGQVRALRSAPAKHDSATAYPFEDISLGSPRGRLASLDTAATDSQRRYAYFYLDSLFPIRLGVWDVRYLVAEMLKDALLDRLRVAVPNDAKYSLRVENVLERSKDGGCFVNFSYIPPSRAIAQEQEEKAEAEQAAEAVKADSKKADNVEETEAKEDVPDPSLVDIQDLIRAHFAKQTNLKPWYLFSPLRVFLVRGKPWLEDMNRFPNSVIRIEFEGTSSDIPQEQLWEMLRPYGRIHDITPQPPSSKDLPRYAEVQFRTTRSAAAARNCLHGLRLKAPSGSIVLRILYKERLRSHAMRDWISSHPRIVLPIVAVLLGGLSYLVFDPIRGFFVRAHVCGMFDFNEYRLVKWLKVETLDRLGFSTRSQSASPGTGIEKERQEAAAQLSTWLRDTPDTFIVITGPRGSGKHAVLDQALANQRNVLEINCEDIVRSAKNDNQLVSEIARQTGYWPVFGFLASLNSMLDLAAVGLIGTKAGFATSVDQQIKQIFEVTASSLKKLSDEAKQERTEALRKIEASKQTKTEKEKQVETAIMQGEVRDSRLQAVSGLESISEAGVSPGQDSEKEIVAEGPGAANELRKISDDILGASPDASADLDKIPIVVIRGFYNKGGRKQDMLWTALADWAALLVENQIAHVVLTSDSVSVTKPLQKAMPSKPMSSMINLTDASSDNALQYISAKLAELNKGDLLNKSTEAAVMQLGGRLTDLEILIQKVRGGIDLDEAVDDIVSRSAAEIRKNAFGDDNEEASNLPWTRSHAWAICKQLSANDELKYSDTLHNTFKDNDKALHALEQSEIISIVHRDGRPSAIKPGKPVYRSAFQRLTSDPIFFALNELASAEKAIATAEADIAAAEKDLVSLGQLFSQDKGRWIFGNSSAVPVEIASRVDGLLAKMRAAEDAITASNEKIEKQVAVLRSTR